MLIDYFIVVDENEGLTNQFKVEVFGLSSEEEEI